MNQQFQPIVQGKPKTPPLAIAIVAFVIGLILGIGAHATTAGDYEPKAAPATTVTATSTETVEIKGAATQTTVTATVTAKPAETKAETKTPSKEVGAGVHKIGEDIPAGRYTTTVPDGSFAHCYWARLKDDAGDLSSIIANDNLIGAGTKGSLTLKDTDAFVEFSGTCVWVKAA